MYNFEIKTPYLLYKNNKIYLLNYHELDNADYENNIYYLNDNEIKMNGNFLINNLKIVYNIKSLEDGKYLNVNIIVENSDSFEESYMSILLDNIHKDIGGI
jgi:hypothetical protein